jgi:ribosomal protein S18 acetylase RimI-like enzyme
MNKPSLLLLFWFLLLDDFKTRKCNQVNAFSTISPSSSSPSPSSFVKKNEKNEIKIKKEKLPSYPSLPSSIRIRTTKEDDLPTIIDLLTYETQLSEQQQHQQRQSQQQQRSSLFGNWNINIKKLKSESSFNLQLKDRLNVLQHASKILSHQQQQQQHHQSPDEIRYALWSDDNFRSKFEKAVRTTKEFEETIWDEWNFAITPQYDMLHHLMISAIDDDFLGETVGFCEVGICEFPKGIMSNDNNEDDDAIYRYVPCIGNLVVSPNQRKRGIGKKLVQSVVRLFTIQQQQHQQQMNGLLGLYVDKSNESAIRLYEREGFVIMKGTDETDDGKIFMLMNTKNNNQNSLENRDNEDNYDDNDERLQENDSLMSVDDYSVISSFD